MKRTAEQIVEKDSPRNEIKRQASVPPPFLHHVVEAEMRTPASFLSVCSRDICTYLSLFLRRAAPRVKNPAALRLLPNSLALPTEGADNPVFDAHDNLVCTGAYTLEGVMLCEKGKNPSFWAMQEMQLEDRPCACVVDQKGNYYVSCSTEIAMFGADRALKNKIIFGTSQNTIALSLDETVLYVAIDACSGDDAVAKLSTSDLTRLSEFGEQERLDIQAMDVLSTDQILVCSTDKCFIFNPDGTLASTFDVHFHLRQIQEAGCTVYNMWPFKVAIDADDNIYITQFNAGHVLVLSVTGAEVARFGIGELDKPDGVAIDSTGRVAVVDSKGMRVQFFA